MFKQSIIILFLLCSPCLGANNIVFFDADYNTNDTKNVGSNTFLQSVYFEDGILFTADGTATNQIEMYSRNADGSFSVINSFALPSPYTIPWGIVGDGINLYIGCEYNDGTFDWLTIIAVDKQGNVWGKTTDLLYKFGASTFYEQPKGLTSNERELFFLTRASGTNYLVRTEIGVGVLNLSTGPFQGGSMAFNGYDFVAATNAASSAPRDFNYDATINELFSGKGFRFRDTYAGSQYNNMNRFRLYNTSQDWVGVVAGSR